MHERDAPVAHRRRRPPSHNRTPQGHAPAPRAASALAPCNALTPSPAAAAQVVPGGPLHIELGGGRQAVELHRLEADGVEWLFVDHPVFQRPGTPYGAAASARNILHAAQGSAARRRLEGLEASPRRRQTFRRAVGNLHRRADSSCQMHVR
jgi:hypothetical protein